MKCFIDKCKSKTFMVNEIGFPMCKKHTKKYNESKDYLKGLVEFMVENNIKHLKVNNE